MSEKVANKEKKKIDIVQFLVNNALIILIVVEAVCLFLANRFIKKDEELVRSADRLR